MTTPKLSQLPVRRARGREDALTLRQIAETALRIVDAEGLEGLTIRRLATELETSPPAIYRVAADKDEILSAIGELVTGMLVIPESGTWEERLLGTFLHLRAIVIEHPASGYINFFHPPQGPEAVRGLNGILSILADGGLEGERAVGAMRMLAAYTFGYTVLGLAYDSVPAHPQHRAVRAAPAEAYPILAAFAEAMTSPYSEPEFRRGLELMIRGLAAEVADR